MMKTLKEWAKAHGVTFVGRSAGVYTTGTVSAGALEELFAEADALRRERDALAARLEEIEAQQPVAWLYHDARTAHEAHPWLHSTMVVLNADRRPGLRGETPLYTRPAPAAAPERAEPARQELTALERDLLDALQGAYSLAIGHAATYQHQHQLTAPHPTHAKILSQSRAAIAKASATTADVPAPAEPQPRPVCATNGLLGATSGVGRECDYWAGGVCASPDPCQHQQSVKPCRCGPDGCSDSVACPKGAGSETTAARRSAGR